MLKRDRLGMNMRATRMALAGTSALAVVWLSHAAALAQTAAPALPTPQAAPSAESAAPAPPAAGQAPAEPAPSQTAPAPAAGPQATPSAPAEIDMPQVTVEGRQPKPARRAARSEPGRRSTTVAAPLPGPTPAPAPTSPFNPPFAPLSTIGSNQIQTGSSNGGFGSLFTNMPGATSAGLATESSRPILRGLSDAKVRIQENGVGAVDVSTSRRTTRCRSTLSPSRRSTSFADRVRSASARKPSAASSTSTTTGFRPLRRSGGWLQN
ncbi:hypothetical protein ACFXS9_23010 [Bradyrhizobium sp. RDI18]